MCGYAWESGVNCPRLGNFAAADASSSPRRVCAHRPPSRRRQLIAAARSPLHSHSLLAVAAAITVPMSADAAAPSDPGSAGAPSTQVGGAPPNPSEVGWQFVPQYYTFVNKHPNRLHCFYTKASTFLHGTEGEDLIVAHGQQVGVFML
jgi:hypothetical protein